MGLGWGLKLPEMAAIENAASIRIPLASLFDSALLQPVADAPLGAGRGRFGRSTHFSDH